MIETEYYVIDIPKAIEMKRRHEAIQKLEQLSIVQFPHLDKSGRSEIINALRQQAKMDRRINKFDRAAMDRLHALVSSGSVRGIKRVGTGNGG